MYKSILISIAILYSCNLFAQTPQNRQGGRYDPARMAEMEKQMILDSLNTLNDDQKLIIEAIYKDYAEAIKNARADLETGDREAMRNKIIKVRTEKTEALKAIFTAEQFTRYENIMRARREQFGNRRTNRNE